MDKRRNITALVMDPHQNLRAAYVVPNEQGKNAERKDTVLGWAAVGGQVYPLRLDKRAGRAVVVGTPDDPDAERFFGVVAAGESLAALGEELDHQVMEMLRKERDDAEADED